ncbi:hypothetical protein [Wolbachia endosymbiont (group A) of Cheilosia soror]|nr:hypothetical protein [Wolbachia endosymbiont (group A) of Cheilosia soror]
MSFQCPCDVIPARDAGIPKKDDVIPVWDPENLTLNKWLHNKD